MAGENIELGLTCINDEFQDADAVAFEDDHGLLISLSHDTYIRIEPQVFPKLIALMAETMDGMVAF